MPAAEQDVDVVGHKAVNGDDTRVFLRGSTQ